MASLFRLFSRLSNRTIALGILVVVIGMIGYGLYFIFGKNIGTFEIQSPIPLDFTVQIKKGDLVLYERACTTICRIEDVPAGTYTVLLDSTGKDTLQNTSTLKRWEIGRITADFAARIEIRATWEREWSKDPENIGEFWGYEYQIQKSPLALTRSPKGGNPSSSSGSVSREIVYSGETLSGYRNDSIRYGYWTAITVDGRLLVLDLSSGASLMIDIPDRTKIDQVKKLGQSERLVLLGRDFPSQIYTPSTATQRSTAPYDDLTQSPSGTLIGLIKAENTTAKSLLSLSESGDLIVDSTQVGRPKVLLSGESDIRAIWSNEGVFRIVKNDGSESIIDGIQ